MSLALRHVPPFLVVSPSILNLDVPSHHAPCPPSVSPPRNIYHVVHYLSITNQLLILIGHLYINLSGLCWITLRHPILLNAARSSMRLRCGSRGGSDASSGGFGWVGAKIAPYFLDWVGPYLIS
jgi:hypothetical protein